MQTITISVDAFVIAAIVALVVFAIIAFVEYREYKATHNLQQFVIQRGLHLEEMFKAHKSDFTEVASAEIQIAVHLDELEKVLDDTNTRVDAIEIMQEAHREVLALKPRTTSVKRNAD